MSTVAFLAFCLVYVIAPDSPITWVLLAATIASLVYDTARLARKEAR